MSHSPHNCIRDLQYPPLSVPTMKAPVALLLLLLLLFLDVLLVAGELRFTFHWAKTPVVPKGALEGLGHPRGVLL